MVLLERLVSLDLKVLRDQKELLVLVQQVLLARKVLLVAQVAPQVATHKFNSMMLQPLLAAQI
jgi:hypothetical protein